IRHRQPVHLPILRFEIIALVAPAALGAGLDGEGAARHRELAAKVELRAPFLVPRDRQAGDLHAVELISRRVAEDRDRARTAAHRIARPPRIGEIEPEQQAIVLEAPFEIRGVDRSILALGRFRIADRIFRVPAVAVGLAAQRDAADALALETVLQRTLDLKLAVGIAIDETGAAAGDFARILELEARFAAIFLIVELAVDAAGVKLGR